MEECQKFQQILSSSLGSIFLKTVFSNSVKNWKNLKSVKKLSKRSLYDSQLIMAKYSSEYQCKQDEVVRNFYFHSFSMIFRVLHLRYHAPKKAVFCAHSVHSIRCTLVAGRFFSNGITLKRSNSVDWVEVYNFGLIVRISENL